MKDMQKLKITAQLRIAFSTILIILAVLLLSGCSANKIALRHVDEDIWVHDMYRSALNARSLSETSQRYLRKHDLIMEWRTRPEQVIHQLDQLIGPESDRDILFILAELAYARAEKSNSSANQLKYYRSAVIYSWAYLFDPRLKGQANPYKHRFRMAHDIYNISLAEMIKLEREIKNPDGSQAGVLAYFRQTFPRTYEIYSQSIEKLKEIIDSDATRPPMELARGVMHISHTSSAMAWRPEEFDSYVSAYEYEVRGFYNHSRTDGLGVPLILTRTPPPKGQRSIRDEYLTPLQQTYAATLVLRVNGSICDRDPQNIVYDVSLELYDPMQQHEVDIAGRPVPLETDLSTPIAYALNIDPPALDGLKGLFDVAAWKDIQGLYMLEPYNPDKIPVVLVHGLRSSPLTWLQIINELLADPQLRSRYQFWFFLYPTGNNIVYSASLLRQALTEAHDVFDPEGQNPHMQNMVLIGHSMGGLLVKMMIQDSGTTIWDMITDQPIDRISLAPEDRDFIEKQVFFTPLAFVSRAIFIAVPHRGSQMALARSSEIASSLITLPADMIRRSYNVMRSMFSGREITAGMVEDLLDTGIDSLKPGNRLLMTIDGLPYAEDIPYHSILGNELAADTPGGTDTVVTYDSAHLEGAVSEKIIKSKHSVQRHPLAILEMQRILHLHLDLFDDRMK